MKTIIVKTCDDLVPALRDAGCTPYPLPRGSVFTITAKDGPTQFVVLEMLADIVVKDFDFVEDEDVRRRLVEALIDAANAIAIAEDGE